jgi:fatty acid CoA ligase FadD22
VAPAYPLATAAAEAARRHGDVPIRLDRPLDLSPADGTALTYRRFAELVDRAAAALAGRGLAAGDRVAIVRRPSFDVQVLALGCARAGLVPVLLFDRTAPADLATLLARSEARLVVTDPETETRQAAAFGPQLPRVHATPEGLLAGRPGALPPPAAPPPDTPQLVTHTSGTTGTPKLVLHSVASFAGHARPQVVIGRVLRVRSPWVACLPSVHARTMSGLLAALRLGLPIGLLTDPDPERAAAMCRELRPGVLEAVPNVFIRWEELAGTAPDAMAGVRILLCTFDALHPRTVRTLLSVAAPGARFLQAYGQTETGPITVKVYRRRGGRCRDSRCVGRPVPGNTAVRVLDADGDRLGYGVPGVIWARSAGITPSYLGGRHAVPADGWWPMGDHGELSARGCLHLHDRGQDRIDGVASVLALEDRILDRLPELTEVALVDGAGRPRPAVCTRGDEPLDLAAWARAVADLPPLAEPVQLSWDEVPHTSTWKVRRSLLRRLLEEPARPAAAEGVVGADA